MPNDLISKIEKMQCLTPGGRYQSSNQTSAFRDEYEAARAEALSILRAQPAAATVPGDDSEAVKVLREMVAKLDAMFVRNDEPGGLMARARAALAASAAPPADIPTPIWWIDHGSHGQITLRQDEADSARQVGAAVYQYHAAPQEQPSDEDIDALFGMWGWKTKDGREFRPKHWREITRLLLSRYGAAPQAGEDAQPATPDWEPLPEDATERAMFDQNLDRLHKGDPRIAITNALRIWSYALPGGSLRAICAVLANEVAKLHLAPATPQAAAQGAPHGFKIKHVEGHGWIIDPPTGSRWVAHENTPAADLIAALTTQGASHGGKDG